MSLPTQLKCLMYSLVHDLNYETEIRNEKYILKKFYNSPELYVSSPTSKTLKPFKLYNFKHDRLNVSIMGEPSTYTISSISPYMIGTTVGMNLKIFKRLIRECVYEEIYFTIREQQEKMYADLFKNC